MPASQREELLALSSDAPRALDRFAALDVAMGHVFADAVVALIEKSAFAAADIRAVGSHGQTVRHSPSGSVPHTVQIGDPNIIVERTGITTVADFRRRDVAAGGQGAPLVPAFHQAVFREPDVARVVVNIGGIANITVLPADMKTPVTGFDTGPGNVLLDAWASEHLAEPMDRDGRWAERATTDPALLEIFCSDDYFLAPPPKSTGREYFDLDWIRAKVDRTESTVSPEQIQRTLCDLTVVTVGDAVMRYGGESKELLVCGGGVHNPILLEGLEAYLNGWRVQSTAAYGVDPDWVEAAAFAWLAHQTVEGLPGNLPSVTGASRPVILGGIYSASP